MAERPRSPPLCYFTALALLMHIRAFSGRIVGLYFTLDDFA